MELWIRSQDRKVLTCNPNLEIRIQNLGDNIGRSHIIDNIGRKLGTYQTKERALEILDGIQNILKPVLVLDPKSIKPNGNFYKEDEMILQNYSGNCEVRQLDTYVYEMPQE